MKVFLAGGAALLALVPPVFGSTQARVRACTVNVLNTSGHALYLKKAASIPRWTPGYQPQPVRLIADHALLYWETKPGRGGCWSRTVYGRGRRFVVLTVDGRTGHPRVARCTQKGFRRCQVFGRRVRPDVFLSVRVT